MLQAGKVKLFTEVIGAGAHVRRQSWRERALAVFLLWDEFPPAVSRRSFAV